MNYYDYPSTQTNAFKHNLSAMFGWKYSDISACRRGKQMVIKYLGGKFKTDCNIELFYSEIVLGKR